MLVLLCAHLSFQRFVRVCFIYCFVACFVVCVLVRCVCCLSCWFVIVFCASEQAKVNLQVVEAVGSGVHSMPLDGVCSFCLLLFLGCLCCVCACVQPVCWSCHMVVPLLCCVNFDGICVTTKMTNNKHPEIAKKDTTAETNKAKTKRTRTKTKRTRTTQQHT